MKNTNFRTSQYPGHGKLNRKLFECVKKNDLKELERLTSNLNYQIINATFSIILPDNIEKKDEYLPTDNLSLLHIAAYFDSLECFIYLHNYGIKIDFPSANGLYPVHYACLKASIEVLYYILSIDSTQATIIANQSKIHQVTLAVISKSIDTLNLLFECNADIKLPHYKENSPIKYAIQTKQVDMLKDLLKQGIKTDNRDFTPLMLAVQQLQVEAIPLLLQAGESPSYITPSGECALSQACFMNNVEIVKELCQHLSVSDIDNRQFRDKAAVHWICQSHNPEIARIILEKGIDVNKFDKNGYPGPYYMLDIFPEENTIQILDLLYSHGWTDVDYIPQGFKTNTSFGFFVSSMQCSPAIIEWFLLHGANPNAPLYQPPFKSILEFVRQKRITARIPVRAKIYQLFQKYCEL